MAGTSTLTQSFTLRMPNALMARLRKIAKAEGRSVAVLVVDALEAAYPASADAPPSPRKRASKA